MGDLGVIARKPQLHRLGEARDLGGGLCAGAQALLLPAAPEIFLVVMAMVILLADVVVKNAQRSVTFVLTVCWRWRTPRSAIQRSAISC